VEVESSFYRRRQCCRRLLSFLPKQTCSFVDEARKGDGMERERERRANEYESHTSNVHVNGNVTIEGLLGSWRVNNCTWRRGRGKTRRRPDNGTMSKSMMALFTERNKKLVNLHKIRQHIRLPLAPSIVRLCNSIWKCVRRSDRSGLAVGRNHKMVLSSYVEFMALVCVNSASRLSPEMQNTFSPHWP
jgi:hypothetical protein